MTATTHHMPGFPRPSCCFPARTPARPWLERSERECIVQWLRRLAIELSLARAEDIGMELQRLVRAALNTESGGSGISPDTAGHIAKEVLDAITQPPPAAL